MTEEVKPKRRGNPNWSKGVSGNPKGRKPLILPELQRELDTNKAKLKTLVLTYFNMTQDQITFRQGKPDIPYIEVMLGQCFQKTAEEGCVDRFRKLLEIVFGKIPEEKHEFQVSEAERTLVLEYRKRLSEQKAEAALERRGVVDSGSAEGSASTDGTSETVSTTE